MIAWIEKLLSGFAIWRADKIGKVIYFAVLVILALTIYTKAFIDPKFKNISTQNIQRVEKIEYHNEVITEAPKETFFLGLNIKGWKLGASK
jgi:hypothetical protein